MLPLFCLPASDRLHAREIGTSRASGTTPRLRSAPGRRVIRFLGSASARLLSTSALFVVVSSSTMSAPGATAAAGAAAAIPEDGAPGAGAAANVNVNGGNSASQSSGGTFSGTDDDWMMGAGSRGSTAWIEMWLPVCRFSSPMGTKVFHAK
nr:uncharacterized protein LOC112939246 [Oryza sativa Japonica Group]